MSDPLSIGSNIPTSGALTGAGAGSAPSGGSPGFAQALREQLARVSRMQHEADEGVQRLLTGQSQSITEVFVAARKAEVAFSLLLEIRNKLTEAWQELQNLRV